MELTPGVYNNYESTEDDGTSAAGFSKLMRTAGTTRVGKDGRLLDIRRRRRYRLGVRSGQLARMGMGQPGIEHHRFQQLDEEHVAQKLLDWQWEADEEGYGLEW